MNVVAQGFLTSLSLVVAIGAQNAFVLRQGLRREHVLVVVVTCALADALLISAGIAGVGAAITSRPALLTATRYVGGAFLLTFAVMAALRAWRPGQLLPAEEVPAGRTAVLLACLGFTFLNPHVYLDTVVLLGTLAGQHGHDGRWEFGAGAAAASVTWFVALGFGARRLGPLFARPRAWRVLDGAISVVMAALAVALVL